MYLLVVTTVLKTDACRPIVHSFFYGLPITCCVLLNLKREACSKESGMFSSGATDTVSIPAAPV